jgi:hypothetical protein
VVSEPIKCKYCGTDAIAHDDVFASGWRAVCGSWDFGHGLWGRGEACYWRCAWRLRGLELDELRQRIDAAISRAGRAVQFGLTPCDGVVCVFASDLDDVVKILAGNSPINSESSE